MAPVLPGEAGAAEWGAGGRLGAGETLSGMDARIQSPSLGEKSVFTQESIS